MRLAPNLKVMLTADNQPLVLQEHPDQQTVYTVRLSTGSTRGSGLSEPNAGVQLCLVGASGVALLHHISPVLDPQKLQEELDAINQVSQ